LIAIYCSRLLADSSSGVGAVGGAGERISRRAKNPLLQNEGILELTHESFD